MKEKDAWRLWKLLCALCAFWGALKTVFCILYPKQFSKCKIVRCKIGKQNHAIVQAGLRPSGSGWGSVGKRVRQRWEAGRPSTGSGLRLVKRWRVKSYETPYQASRNGVSRPMKRRIVQKRRKCHCWTEIEHITTINEVFFNGERPGMDTDT